MIYRGPSLRVSMNFPPFTGKIKRKNEDPEEGERPIKRLKLGADDGAALGGSGGSGGGHDQEFSAEGYELVPLSELESVEITVGKT